MARQRLRFRGDAVASRQTKPRRIGAFARARRFFGDRRGNFAVLFALTAPIFVLIVGLGLDYLDGLTFKTRWDAAADFGALAAVKAAQAYASANAATQNAPDLQADASAAGSAAGLKAFNANAGASESNAVVTPQVTMTVTGSKFTATVSYAGTIKGNFGGWVGINQLAISGTSVASGTSPTFSNYYFIIDISQSMGVAATATDMQNLFDRTTAYGNGGCVFGCHIAELGATYSNEFLAHAVSPYITLRIDAAKSAIQSVLSDAQSNFGSSGNVQFAIYTMQQNPSTGTVLVQVAGLSSNYSGLSTAVDNVDLDPNVVAGLGDSDFTASMNQFQTNVVSSASSGGGASPSTPINYVFIITDGVQDVFCAVGVDGHCTGPFDPSLCASMKSKATVGVIYTTYLPIYTNNNPAFGFHPAYAFLVQPFASQIAPNLQACASGANWYYEASDGPALNAAMQQLFTSTFSALALVR